jgi:hypothetical protein
MCSARPPRLPLIESTARPHLISAPRFSAILSRCMSKPVRSTVVCEAAIEAEPLPKSLPPHGSPFTSFSTMESGMGKSRRPPHASAPRRRRSWSREGADAPADRGQAGLGAAVGAVGPSGPPPEMATSYNVSPPSLPLTPCAAHPSLHGHQAQHSQQGIQYGQVPRSPPER